MVDLKRFFDELVSLKFNSKVAMPSFPPADVFPIEAAVSKKLLSCTI